MPFKSQAQRRKFAQLLVEGKISDQTFEEWNRETGGKTLPERVSAGRGARASAKPASAKRKSVKGKTVKRKAVKQTAAKRKSRKRKAPGRTAVKRKISARKAKKGANSRSARARK
jgi:hypothetical protein